MKKVSRNEKVLAVITLIIVIGFFALVVLPVTYTGAEMILTHFELVDYNLNQYKTDTNFIYGEGPLMVRQSLANSIHPLISLMASSTWIVWLPMFLLLGLYPIVLMLNDFWAPFRKVAAFLKA